MHQLATLDMLQNQLVTVQRRIQKLCHIEGRSLCNNSKWTIEKCSLLSENVFFRCARFLCKVLEIENSLTLNLLKCDAKLLLNIIISNPRKFREILRLCLSLANQSLIYENQADRKWSLKKISKIYFISTSRSSRLFSKDK